MRGQNSGNSFKHAEGKKKLTSADWNVICFSLASEVKYMHLKNLLQNDLMSNNVFLKLRNNAWIPKLAVMEKVTLKSNPETYLSNSQSDCYNKIYTHLAYELSNIYGSKTSFSSDIFSFGYLFIKHLFPSNPILHVLTLKMLVYDPKKRVTIICF